MPINQLSLTTAIKVAEHRLASNQSYGSAYEPMVVVRTDNGPQPRFLSSVLNLDTDAIITFVDLPIQEVRHV